ncbi:PH domain-containing protein [Nocardioides sp.]|uniref:PH domain-containing protein n=1 Tax=Nocardioides sp. TaxID=35761 RepID=UPI00351388DD
MPPPPPAPWASEPAGTWQRLDPRMLLVHPVRELVRFWPALLGLLVAGGASGTGPWGLVAVAVPVTLGVVRYLTTTWRITEQRIEVRRGLLQRHTLAARLERVRTVDLTASPIHRVLGLATVAIGTGSVVGDDDERLELDALPREVAAGLRVRLLEQRLGAGADAVAGTGDATGAGGSSGSTQRTVLARFEPRWLLYAPFSGTALLAVGAVAGGAGQLASETGLPRIVGLDERDLGRVDQFSILLVASLAAGGIALIGLIALGSYLVLNGGFVLSREGSAWHVRRGLLTRRETSIDVDRLAGVSLGEPLLLRVARGRRLDGIVTGLARAPGVGAAALVPPAPAATVTGAAGVVLGSGTPLEAALRTHGPAARRRRFTRAAAGAAVPGALLVLAVLGGAPGVVLVLLVPLALGALALAGDRWRALGHALVPDPRRRGASHLVVRSGSLTRRREALATDHVIGWTTRATWFQRRLGLVHLAATTAGGRGHVDALDIPVGDAVALARAATPGLLEPFLVGTSAPSAAVALGPPAARTAPRHAPEPAPATKESTVSDSDYRPRPDGHPDPGEVVWTWVPYEDDPQQGKDRPVLVIGTDTTDDGRSAVRCLVMTSKDHDRDAAQEERAGRRWMDVGTGGWDRQGRPSEVRLNRLLVVPVDDVRREGAALDRDVYERVLAARAEFEG